MFSKAKLTQSFTFGCYRTNFGATKQGDSFIALSGPAGEVAHLNRLKEVETAVYSMFF